MRGRSVGVGRRGSLAGALVIPLLCAAARDAHADGDTVKGTIGGAMLGAEAVMLTESAFRLRPGWLYLVGGAAGALGGGYLGHELSDDASNRPPAFLLAGGIALIIPTIMGVLTATQYEPATSIRQEPPGGDDFDPDDFDDAPGAGEGARTAPRLELPHFELPSLELAQAFSRDELARFRVRQAPELHVSLLRGVF